MSDRCHVEVIQADGWSEACNQPAQNTIIDFNDHDHIDMYPACDYHFQLARQAEEERT
jgi:uncharacterized protein YbdZ (MbtH family)